MALSEKKKKIICSLLLVLIAIIWGLAFVVQSEAMNVIKPFTFNALRSFVGGFSVLVFSLISGIGKPKPKLNEQEKGKQTKTLFLGGICCGVCLFFASNLQQLGLVSTSPGKAGFITALYIVLVPLLGLFFRRRVGWKVWLGVALAVAGLYLLCVTDSFAVAKSDILVLLCAGCYACHIMVIAHFSPLTDGVKMSCIQFFVAAVLSSAVALVTEGMPSAQTVFGAWKEILYVGVMSSGVAFTLQIIAQKHVNETVASLLMSSESLFAAVFSWLILNKGMSSRELIGAMLMVIALVLAQLPQKLRSRSALGEPEGDTALKVPTQNVSN